MVARPRKYRQARRILWPTPGGTQGNGSDAAKEEPGRTTLLGGVPSSRHARHLPSDPRPPGVASTGGRGLRLDRPRGIERSRGHGRGTPHGAGGRRPPLHHRKPRTQAGRGSRAALARTNRTFRTRFAASRRGSPPRARKRAEATLEERRAGGSGNGRDQVGGTQPYSGRRQR